MEGTRHEPIFNVPNLQSINKRDDRFFIETNHQHRGHLRKDRSSLLEGGRRTDTVRLSPSEPFVCNPPRPTERASERERAIPTSHERSNADGPETTRGVSTGASVSGASDDRSDGKDGRRRRTKRQGRARRPRERRRDGRTDGRTPRRTDGRTDAATRRFGALGTTVVRDCGCL